MSTSYQLKQPYPIPSGLGDNRCGARQLLIPYCGGISELTSFCQYMYHYQFALPEYLPVAEAYYGICAVEMQHMSLLGNCIKQMGVAPKYRIITDAGACNWSVRNVDYCANLRDALRRDIANEEDTIRQYCRILNRTVNSQIRALLERIIEDEKLHVKVFTDLYNHYF